MKKQTIFLTLMLFLSIISFSQKNIDTPGAEFNSNKNIRGWSYDGEIASFITYENGKSYLYIGTLNDYAFTEEKKIKFSTGDNVRGWNWDGQTASYAGVEKGKTYLIVRPFDGDNFGSYRKVFLSKTDSFRGWSWDGETASYIAYAGGKSHLYIRPFDGINFGDYSKKFFSSGNNILGWNWNDEGASYQISRYSKTFLIQRTFDGQKFGSYITTKIKNPKYKEPKNINNSTYSTVSTIVFNTDNASENVDNVFEISRDGYIEVIHNKSGKQYAKIEYTKIENLLTGTSRKLYPGKKYNIQKGKYIHTIYATGRQHGAIDGKFYIKSIIRYRSK